MAVSLPIGPALHYKLTLPKKGSSAVLFKKSISTSGQAVEKTFSASEQTSIAAPQTQSSVKRGFGSFKTK